MPKYLFRSSYTVEGLEGFLEEGGSGQREAVRKGIESLGGTLEAFYYAFGDTDVFVIVDLPDNVTAAFAAIVSNASGSVVHRTTVLITPEEVDEAVKLVKEEGGAYRPPGQ